MHLTEGKATDCNLDYRREKNVHIAFAKYSAKGLSG